MLKVVIIYGGLDMTERSVKGRYQQLWYVVVGKVCSTNCDYYRYFLLNENIGWQKDATQEYLVTFSILVKRLKCRRSDIYIKRGK